MAHPKISIDLRKQSCDITTLLQKQEYWLALVTESGKLLELARYINQFDVPEGKIRFQIESMEIDICGQKTTVRPSRPINVDLDVTLDDSSFSFNGEKVVGLLQL